MTQLGLTEWGQSIRSVRMNPGGDDLIGVPLNKWRHGIH
jgi:hypothetical protein